MERTKILKVHVACLTSCIVCYKHVYTIAIPMHENKDRAIHGQTVSPQKVYMYATPPVNHSLVVATCDRDYILCTRNGKPSLTNWLLNDSLIVQQKRNASML